MPRLETGMSVFGAALARMYDLYSEGHRIVITFSGGKDSGVVLEIALLAAELAGRLPIDVIMRGEEVMLPGTFEYSERIAARPEINFHWIYACQPIVSIYNRHNPYWWVFDPTLDPEQWVRQPPSMAYRIPQLSIDYLVHPDRFPPAEGKQLYKVLGLRVSESINRQKGLYSSGGYLTRSANRYGVYACRPIYDWKDTDVWKSIYDNQWDYNEAYDVMHRLGISRGLLRIAPPTMMEASAPHLQVAAKAWPRWFEKVCERCPGVRNAQRFGKSAVEPYRLRGESWNECFHRLCIRGAPKWIAERAEAIRDVVLYRHGKHSTQPLGNVKKCTKCGQLGSWETMARVMYNGDPFLSRVGPTSYGSAIECVEPELFRPGAGQWEGKPTF